MLGRFCITFISFVVILGALPVYGAEGEALPSWNEGVSKTRIIEFVKAVTDKDSKDFVPVDKRVAVFDNDGTLWCEQPIYPQLVFAIERVKNLVEEKPELKDDPIVRAAIAKDYDSLAKSGAHGIMKLMAITHSGMTVSAFEDTVRRWMSNSKHSKFDRPFNKCVYKPMLEVLDYLRANGFRTYIVTGGGRDFMRAWAHTTYGVEPERISGSYSKLEYRDGDVYKTAKLELLNDGKGKPVGIQSQIGLKPIAAFGNSDGDYEMLLWTSKGEGRKLCAIVHHTDADREYSYDRKSKVGHLEKALDQSKERDWLVIDMKKDWLKIFPAQ